MTRLSEVASVVRSKNAGPRLLTLDLIFPDVDTFRAIQAAASTLRQRVAVLYGLAEADVVIIDYAPANAIKIVLPRPVTSGDPGDRDVYGAQQHAPLLEIEL